MNSPDRKRKLWVIGLFALALSLRLLYWLFLKRNYAFYDSPSDDVLYYHQWARSIASGDNPREVFWGMPLYPYFLAFLYQLTLGNLFLIRFLHVVLGALNCVLTFGVAEKIFSPRVAILASLLMACNFVLIYYDGLMLPVTLLITLGLVVVLNLLRWNAQSGKKEWFLLGLLIGLGMLGDGKLVLFFPFLLSWLGKRYRRERSLTRVIFPLSLGVLIVVGGVVLRNRLISGDWVFVSAQSGFSFYVGNNPQSDGIFDNPPFIRPTHQGQDEDQRIIAENLSGKPLKPSEVSGFWIRQAFQFIRDEPWNYLKLLKNKFYFFWIDHEAAYDIDLLLQKEWKDLWDWNSFFLIAPLAICGMILTRSRRPGQGLSWPTGQGGHGGVVFLNGMILSQLFFTLIFFLTTKYRTTIVPFLIMYEAYSLFWLTDQLKARRVKEVLVFLSCLLVLLVALRPIGLNPHVIDFLKFSKSGTIFEKKGDYPRAREAYRRALRIHPRDANLLYNLANTFLAQGDPHQAVEYYRQALLLNPYHGDALFNLAVSYEELGERPLALQYYQKVLAEQPGSPDIHFRLARLYHAQGLCQEARSHYEAIRKLDPRFDVSSSIFPEGCPPDMPNPP